MANQNSKFILMLASFIIFCITSQAAISTVAGVSGYVSSVSETSVFITEKHGVILEIPKSEIIKTRPKFKKGEYVKVSLEKSLIKATKVKSPLDSK